MSLSDDVTRLQAVENAISDALGTPRQHRMSGAFEFEHWSLDDLERERNRLAWRVCRKSGLTNTVANGGN